MPLSTSTFFNLSLLLVVVTAHAAVNVQQTRQLRYMKGAVSNPVANDRNEQEAVTREDILTQNAPQSAAVSPATSMQQVQTSQLQQMQQMQEQQLLQKQAMQMQQMQQQLLKQQQELQRLQQLEKQQRQPPQQPPKQPQQARRSPVRKSPKKSLVGVKAQMMTKSEMQTSAEAGGASSGIAKPKGWDQCLKFARFVKTQDVTGLELVRVWKSTCEPAVQSGRATERYKLMCNSLSGVIEPYSAQIDYDVEQLCDSVLAVFHDVTAVDAKNR